MADFYGTYQVLSIGSLSLTLSLSSFYFQPGDGEDLLSRLGYSKWVKDGDRPTPVYSPLGQTHYTGLSYGPPWNFAWNIQWMEPSSYRLLKAIVQTAQESAAPVRLEDALIIHAERGTTGTRKRARIGPVNTYPETPGWIYYFAQYDIDPWIVERSEYRLNGRHWLKLEAQEHNPRVYVPLSEDKALAA